MVYKLHLSSQRHTEATEHELYTSHLRCRAPLIISLDLFLCESPKRTQIYIFYSASFLLISGYRCSFVVRTTWVGGCVTVCVYVLPSPSSCTALVWDTVKHCMCSYCCRASWFSASASSGGLFSSLQLNV